MADLFGDIAARTKLVHRGTTRDGRALFVDPITHQQFALIPGGSYVMGMSAAELVAALQDVSYDPRIAFWRDAHARSYRAANPVHPVTVQAFLCGTSPLLGGTVDAAGLGIDWSSYDTEHAEAPMLAAEMDREAAGRVLDHFGWGLIDEAQWEYVARCGARDTWAGGPKFRGLVNDLLADARYAPRSANGWGIWGLALGEWIADDWHADYAGAPSDGSAWRAQPGPPGAVRGGAVLHAPWQDSDEAFGCHVAARGGDGGGGAFVARPVIELPWLACDIAPAVAPAAVDFEIAVAALEASILETHRRDEQREREAAERRARIKRELPGSIQDGKIRSIGDGVYIVRLLDANGILRTDRTLEIGAAVRVRVVGAGGVPEVELVDERG